MAASSSASLRAWLLCAPACAAMLVANILPACRELLGAGPRPLEAEITAWGISLLVVGSHVVALAAVCLTVEAPLALAVAIVILHRTARTPPPARWLAPVIAAGFAWRLLFGGTFGFSRTDGSLWSIAALEAWRTLPLSTLLFYVPLRRAGAIMTDVARLDGADFTRTVARIYLPICRPTALALVALRTVDYLRTIDAPLISPLAVNRVSWLLLLVTVTALAVQVARPRGQTA